MAEQPLHYVRTEMLEAKAPPSSQIGPLRWARENLFSGWFNSLLTLVSLYVILTLLAGIAPWFGHTVWNAGSLSECRKIIHNDFGPNADGACFAVIHERWNQLLYGFYPENGYWRANLALVGMLLAIAPILFSQVPRKLLWFSALYPFAGFWLIWGGSLWFPVAALLGFVVGGIAFRLLAEKSAVMAAAAGFVAACLWWFFAAGPVDEGLSAVFPIALQTVQSRDVGGFLLSIIIGISGITLSLPLGVLLALGRQSNMFFIRTVSVGFIEFIRGVPLITLLFTASLLLNYFLPPGTNFDLILRVVIMVTLFAAAYMAEVIRGGLAALPRGQYEAADALGLDYWKAQRLIIMPQALKISIPGIVNTFIGLFKDTT
ncbi:amino acid ABC transporter permease, partial [Defluviimonas sp. 20V17]